MTKEELKKESQQYTITHTTPSLYRVVDQAYLAGAEPREQRIEELEQENKVIYQRMTMLDETLEDKNKRIEELEKEINDLHEQIDILSL